MAITIINGKIVSPQGIVEKDIRILGEKIDKIGSNIKEDGDQVIDARGNYIIPGAIDAHTHFDADAGGIVADSFKTGTRAALAGGTTTIIDFAEQVKGGSLAQALDQWKELSQGNTYTDYACHMTISDWNQTTEKEMEDMIEEGISSFKMFFAYEDLQLDDVSIYRAIKKAKQLGALTSFHCENGPLIEELRQEAIEAGNKEPIYHAKTRPASLEKEAISRLVAIGDLLDTYIYIVHLSSKEGYEEIQRAREKGSKILVETCPQYLLLNEEYYLPKDGDDFHGGKYVLSPPLRDRESNEILWKGLNDGNIEVVATDHCAFHYESQKKLGLDDFTQIPNGGPGVENRFKLIYTQGVEEGKISLEKMVEVLCEQPAKIFGLYPEKGTIQEGSHADLLIFNPDHSSFIEADKQLQNVDYNLYEGMTEKGKFEYIFLRGRPVVRDEKFLLEEPLGQYQKRKTFK